MDQTHWDGKKKKDSTVKMTQHAWKVLLSLQRADSAEQWSLLLFFTMLYCKIMSFNSIKISNPQMLSLGITMCKRLKKNQSNQI